MYKTISPDEYKIKQLSWGGNIMASLPIDIEIDRLLNLVRGFGWEESRREVTEDQIIITIKKKKPAE